MLKNQKAKSNLKLSLLAGIVFLVRKRRNPFERNPVMKASEIDRSVVLRHAKIAALWSTTTTVEDADYENLDDAFTADDIAGDAEKELVQLIDNFFDLAGDLLDDVPLTDEQIGHDIILTTNRHGAGFWDRGLGELGEKLTEIAHNLGGYELYVGDDGTLHI
jgi:hypothetical protein